MAGILKTSVIILGSTGSIGKSALDVISRHPDKYEVCGLSANTSVDSLFQQCCEFIPQRVVMEDSDSALALRRKLKQAGISIDVGEGQSDLITMAKELGDCAICGIVGAAGLMSTIACVKAGKKVLIANKEPLVMLGAYIVKLAQQHGACLLPLDSEHNAIFQCLPQDSWMNSIQGKKYDGASRDTFPGVEKILLTGSGGPFRALPLDQFHQVTPEQACKHPNWKMGRKISVDSATMMNKGLELIEACVLFSVPEHKVEIVIHPQSVIHSMVEYIDGSIIAQMGSPDMRIPIANALAWPERIVSGAHSLDFSKIAHLDFETPDKVRFPALRLARVAAATGGTLPGVMSAANEVAVQGFLTERVSFEKIPQIVEATMESIGVDVNTDLEHVLEADLLAREFSEQLVKKS